MAEYMLSGDPDWVVRTSDGALVPIGQKTGDSLEYLRWSSLGNVAESSKTIDAEKEKKMREILDGMDAFLASKCCSCCEGEKTSWQQQAAEAEQLAIDPNSSAPLLRGISSARGVPIEDIAKRVRANYANWTVLQGYAMGRKGALLDALSAAQDIADVESIAVSYTTPLGYENVEISFDSIQQP